MADSDKNTRRIDPGRDTAESAQPLGKTTSGKTKTDSKPLKEQDAEWGFEAKKSGMATEAKMGMGIVVILVCAFGFLVYNKFDLKQRQLMQVKANSPAGDETTENVGTEAANVAPFYSADNTTDLAAAVPQSQNQLVGVSDDATTREPVPGERQQDAVDQFAAVEPEPVAEEQAFDMAELELSPEPELIASASPFGDSPSEVSPADEPLTALADRLEAMSAARKEVPTEEPGFAAALDDVAALTPAEEPFDPFASEPVVSDNEPAFDRFDDTVTDSSVNTLAPVEEGAQLSAAPTESDFPDFSDSPVASSGNALPPVSDSSTEKMDIVEAQQPAQAKEPDFRSLFERDIAPNASTDQPQPIESNDPPTVSVADNATDLKFDDETPAVDRFPAEPQALAKFEPSDAIDSPAGVDGFSEFGPVEASQEPPASLAEDVEPTDPSTLVAMLDKPQSGGLFPADESASDVMERRSIVPDSERFSPDDDFALPVPAGDERKDAVEFSPSSEPTIEVPLPRDNGLQIELPRAPVVAQPKSGISVPRQITQPALRMPVVQDVIPNTPSTHQKEDGHAHILLPGTEGVRQVAASTDDIDVMEVKPNDTYWAISKRAYGTSRYFAALALYNQNRIRDPKRLRPGMKVLLPTPEAMEDKYPELFKSSRRKAKLPRGYFLQQDGTPAYRIGERETLSMISQKHLGRASRWMQIYRLNRNILRDPNKLKPGTVIALPDDATDVHLAP